MNGKFSFSYDARNKCDVKNNCKNKFKHKCLLQIDLNIFKRMKLSEITV